MRIHPPRPIRTAKDVGPYIGITGFHTPEEVAAVWELAPPSASEWEGHPGRTLAVGVLVNSESLEGRPVTFRSPGRYPAIDDVPAIRGPHTFNTVHYCSRDRTLDVRALVERCALRPGMGVQLNLTWPSPDILFALKEELVATTLQLNQHTLAEVDWDPGKLTARLRDYRAGIDFLLIDLSRGSGKLLDGAAVSRIMDALGRDCAGPGVVAAGGLGPDTLHLLDPVLSGPHWCSRKFYTSIDAESGVMGPGDRLDLERCREYLWRALPLFGRAGRVARG